VNRLVLLTLVGVLSACSHGPGFLRKSDREDSLYWRALTHLDAANRQGSLDSAITYLEAYLAAGTSQHRQEALVLRQLARDSRQLARVTVALQQVKGDTAQPRPQTDTTTRRRDEEALKEIQRLKEELAKANEELERIRKRLAAPKPPTDR
jgi:aminoglycoside phosphotransferase (APT) family kinase protein